ncbi:MAG: alpha/beta fold hydrolase [Trueperaceae bacterium]|nr:alpha/beta fold hydrolase [Trueperaceae bacterium]
MTKTVVLVHGIFDNSRVFQHLSQQFNNAGFTPYAPDLLPSDGEKGLDELAQQLRDYIEHTVREKQFHLLGFSMGGIICRYYMQKLGGTKRVKRLITVSSPHKGSFWAYFRFNRGGRQLRPNSAFIKDLNKDDRWMQNHQFVSLYTPFDLMIVPASSSVLVPERSEAYPVLAHPLMLTNKQVSQRIIALVKEASVPAASNP